MSAIPTNTTDSYLDWNLTLKEKLSYELIWTLRFLTRKDKLLKGFEAKIEDNLLNRLEKEGIPDHNVKAIEEIEWEDLIKTNDLSLLKKKQPFIIRGGCKHIEAFEKWSADYFEQNYYDCEVNVFSNSTKKDKTQGTFTPEKLGKFIDDSKTGKSNKYIIGASNIFANNRNLLRELNFSSFEKALKLKITSMDFFMGTARNCTRFHYEPVGNIFAMLKGEKKWTLSEQKYTPCFYPLTSTMTPGVFLMRTRIPYMETSDTVSEFKLFNKAPKIKAHLKEADVLVNPGFWWHQVENDDESTATNIAVAHRFHDTTRYSIGSKSFYAFFDLIVMAGIIVNPKLFKIYAQYAKNNDKDRKIDDIYLSEDVFYEANKYNDTITEKINQDT
ncbi:MAG: cupin-like domain-containing protein [Methylococcales bacterium]|nr:cupin-like domain-containing protein [Methylococcales bacterium]